MAMEFVELREENEIGAAYDRAEALIERVFIGEGMTRERFVALFAGGESSLYEVWIDGRPHAVWFGFAENCFTVKLGLIAYSGRTHFTFIRDGWQRIRSRLAARGVRCAVVEIAGAKRRVQRLFMALGFRFCGAIPHYYGDESVEIYSMEVING